MPGRRTRMPFMDRRRALLLLVALALFLGPVVGATIVPDPTWIAGVYDNGDGDEVAILLDNPLGHVQRRRRRSLSTGLGAVGDRRGMGADRDQGGTAAASLAAPRADAEAAPSRDAAALSGNQLNKEGKRGTLLGCPFPKRAPSQ